MDAHRQLLFRYHRHGDAEAFCALVRDHAGMVFATAKRVTQDAALAEDVAQETFLELARSGHEVVESVAAWLHRVAWRKACNAIRGESRRRRREEEAAAILPGAGDLAWEELEPCVDEALQELPADLREALLLHYLEGHTQQEVAARLRVSQSTVSRLLDAGIRELRACLGTKGVTAGAALASMLATHPAPSIPASLTSSLGKLAISGAGAGAGAGTTAGTATLVSSALLTMTTTKIALSLAGAAVLLTLPFYVFRDHRAPAPVSKNTASTTSSKPAPTGQQGWSKAKAPSRPQQAPHYRPAPVSKEVRTGVDGILQRHAGMSKEELMQSKELVSLMNRMIAVLNRPETLQKIQKAAEEVQAVTGAQGDNLMTIDWFENLDDARGRAWLEAAASDDPKLMEDWVINRFKGSVFEFAADPGLTKSSEGLDIAPPKPPAKPADATEKND